MSYRTSILHADLTERIKDLRKERSQPIEIAGPAGNPTQPGHPQILPYDQDNGHDSYGERFGDSA